jgi:hypothetical protein
VRILYIGPDSGTCRQRRFALERLGHQPFVVDPFAALPLRRWSHGWSIKTGALGLEGFVRRGILAAIGDRSFDLVLVDGGELIGPTTVEALKQRAPAIVLFNLDHPFGARDGPRWRLLLRALPYYDLFATPRKPTADGARAAGMARVMQMDFAADEVAHRPLELSDADKARFSADVVFVGTWMPERGPVLKRLVERGVPLRIYGDRWFKAPEYPVLAPCIVPGQLVGDDYAKALQGGKIAIGLLSKGNEDLHTTRSLEIPAMGVLLCAERTSDHERMFRDGVEAVFWDDPDDCADKCLALLADPEQIKAIAAAGHRRVIANKAFNEPLMTRVIAAALAAAAR